MNFTNKTLSEKLYLGAAVGGIISMFLPWVTVSLFGFSESASGFSVGIASWLLVASLLYGGVTAIIGAQREPKLAYGLGGWMIISIIYNIVKMMKQPLGSLGIGFYIVAVAAVVNIVATVLENKRA